MSTPTTISGLKLWLDSSDNATLTLSSGTTLTAWADKSGLSNSSTSISGSPSISTQYSNQYINFNGSSKVLGPVSITTTTLSVFSVCIIPANQGVQARIVSLGIPTALDSGNPVYTVALFVPLNTKNVASYRFNFGTLSQNSNSLSTPIIASSIYDSANCTVYVNGTGATSAATTGNFGITNYGIGNNVDNPIEGFTGYIGEVLVYNTALTLSERQLIEGYLAWKWGLNTSLPGGHPYYSTNPNSSATLPCFARGTRVLTQNGYKAIEMLEHNDYIVTPDRRVIDFKLFKTTVDTTTKHTAPYLIQPHAFGRNVPSAPLRLSATHKIQLADDLWTSPEKAALTNPLVTQCEIGTPVTYYHIECANYLKDNIVTEGMIVESLGTTKATGGKSDIYAWNSKLNAYTRVGHMDSPKSKSA